MSKNRRKSATFVNSPPIKEIYNPFPDLTHSSFYENHTKKSPRSSKRVGKCFQLVLICQKLLKPFSSTKVTQPDMSKRDIHLKEKTMSVQEINQSNRISAQPLHLECRKVDACVQTNVVSFPDITQIDLDHDFDANQECDEFLSDNDCSAKEPYWDLDIDSAIVGDFNSMSGFSLDEQIDPHYTSIKITADGKVIDKAQCLADRTFYTSIYPEEKLSCSNSNASSPKSGVYSRIIKPRKTDDFNSRMANFYNSSKGSRINFEKIIAIRSQFGITHDVPYDYPCFEELQYSRDTPDIPRRNYGSSVINDITKLRQGASYEHSSTNLIFGLSPSVIYLDKELSKNSLYSPIWPAKKSPNHLSSHLFDTPTSEPIVPKRSMNKVLHQLNPIYRDDSSEDASIISVNSPLKVKYSYPRTFSETILKKPSTDADKRSYVNLLNDEIKRFHFMDSELDLNISFCGKSKKIVQPYQKEVIENNTNENVPLDVRTGDENIFLQPLMERSCEEEYFKRDLLSSLDYINV